MTQTARVFGIVVSYTFSDPKAERNALQGLFFWASKPESELNHGTLQPERK